MPNYNYECQDCQQVFEVMASIKDMEKGDFPCPKCGSQKTKRLFDGFGFCNGSGGNGNMPASPSSYPT